MSIKIVCAVFDLKSLVYSQPFFPINAGDAIRAFGDAVVDGKSPFSLHPEDYQLFHVGVWNDVEGSIVPLLPVKLLCSGPQFIKPKLEV